jgi:hypothetical protein
MQPNLQPMQPKAVVKDGNRPKKIDFFFSETYSTNEKHIKR